MSYRPARRRDGATARENMMKHRLSEIGRNSPARPAREGPAEWRSAWFRGQGSNLPLRLQRTPSCRMNDPGMMPSLFAFYSPVDPGGVEPPHFRLKGGCSAIELRIRWTHLGPGRRDARRAHLHHCSCYRSGLTAGRHTSPSEGAPQEDAPCPLPAVAVSRSCQHAGPSWPTPVIPPRSGSGSDPGQERSQKRRRPPGFPEAASAISVP